MGCREFASFGEVACASGRLKESRDVCGQSAARAGSAGFLVGRGLPDDRDLGFQTEVGVVKPALEYEWRARAHAFLGPIEPGSVGPGRCLTVRAPLVVRDVHFLDVRSG